MKAGWQVGVPATMAWALWQAKKRAVAEARPPRIKSVSGVVPGEARLVSASAVQAHLRLYVKLMYFHHSSAMARSPCPAHACKCGRAATGRG